VAFTAVPSSGAKLRASVLEALIVEPRAVAAVKGGDTSVNTDTSHNPDPDLTVTLVPGTHEVDFVGIVTSAANAAGDFSYRWAYPGDAQLSAGGIGSDDTLASGSAAGAVNVAATSADATSPAGPYNHGCSTTPTSVEGKAIVTIVTTGAVTIEWAQASSNGNNTTLKAGSSLVARLLP
jgi:hypothetical protein